MKKIYNYILIGVALIVFLFMLLMLSPLFNIKNIEVKGLNTLDKTNIIRELELDKKTNIFSFNTLIAKKRLKNNYYVEKVTVEKKLPNKVIINIAERQLVGYIPYTNSYIYIDKYGMVVDVKSNYKQPLPIIYGLDFDTFVIGKKLKTKRYEAFEAIIKITNVIKDKEILKEILKINISDLNDIHLHMQNLDVFLGNIEAINVKINTLDEIVKSFKPEQRGFLYLDDINKAPIFKYIT